MCPAARAICFKIIMCLGHERITFASKMTFVKIAKVVINHSGKLSGSYLITIGSKTCQYINL